MPVLSLLKFTCVTKYPWITLELWGKASQYKPCEYRLFFRLSLAAHPSQLDLHSAQPWSLAQPKLDL